MLLWIREILGWGVTGTGTGTNRDIWYELGRRLAGTYVAPYNLQGRQEEGGQPGRFAQCPTAYGPQKIDIL